MLDELEFKSRTTRIDRPIGWLKELLEQQAAGKFAADNAHIVQAEREHERAQQELEADGRDPHGRKKAA